MATSAGPYSGPQSIQLSVQFTNPPGTNSDPGTVKLAYRLPGQAPTVLTYGQSAALLRTGTGAYACQLNALAPGDYAYEFIGVWAGSPPTYATDSGTFTIEPGAV